MWTLFALKLLFLSFLWFESNNINIYCYQMCPAIYQIENLCTLKSHFDFIYSICFKNKFYVRNRDEEPDPVGSVDFWPSGSITFFIGSGSGS